MNRRGTGDITSNTPSLHTSNTYSNTILSHILLHTILHTSTNPPPLCNSDIYSNVLVGGGDGTITYINPAMNLVAGYRTELMGGITSISRLMGSNKLMVGTDQCNRYEVSLDLAEAELKTSCHYGSINDLAFPEGCPDLIVTSSKGDIRIWNTKVKQEIIRIQVPNLDCLCSLVTPSGSSIVSGWDDGKIRAFYPESGRIKFVVPDAHAEKVTALAIADNDGRSPYRIVSGMVQYILDTAHPINSYNDTSTHSINFPSQYFLLHLLLIHHSRWCGRQSQNMECHLIPPRHARFAK